MATRNINKLFILLGYIIFFSFVWIRFIKNKLPHNIPFDLSTGWFLILVCLCFFYGYACYKLFKPQAQMQDTLFIYLATKLKPLLKPLILLNDHFFTNAIFKKVIISWIKLFIFISRTQFIHYNSLYKYFICFILPRILFTLCLIFDCFFLKKLSTIYICIFLITIPLLTKYLLYGVKRITDDSILSLENDFLIEITSKDESFYADDYDKESLKEEVKCYLYEPSTLKYDGDDQEGFLNMQQCNYLKPGNFIKYQSDSLLFNCKPYEYNILFITERSDKVFFASIKRKTNLSKKESDSLLNFLIKINVFFKQVNLGQKYNLIKYFTFILSLLALICWSYILIVSLPYFHFTVLEQIYLNNFQDHYEPFSDIKL